MVGLHLVSSSWIIVLTNAVKGDVDPPKQELETPVWAAKKLIIVPQR